MSVVLFLNFYTANGLVHISVLPGTYLEDSMFSHLEDLLIACNVLL